MANLSKTRTLFAFTSPRTIEKIIPEIEILIQTLNGKVWNAESQTTFFNQLSKSGFYEGDTLPKDVTFAARDRITRAPKSLGFVDLKPVVKITGAGELLLGGKRIHETIARQLLKLQFPSPYHYTFPKDLEFNVRPYLELLRLTKELGNLSKMEIAMFFVQLIHFEKFDSIAEKIRELREKSAQHKGNKKIFVDAIFEHEVSKIYAAEIKSKQFKTRESGDESLAKFLQTKKRNLIDYADAFMRYMRATQLITFDRKTFRMVIAPSRAAEVDYILETVPREAIKFENEAAFKRYLFNPFELQLLTDQREYLQARLTELKATFDPALNTESLKDILEETEKTVISKVIEKTVGELKHYKEFDDVVSVYDKIVNREMPDPSLYLEWNTWRALVMINYAKDVRGNFRLDLDGLPLNTALGNMPDIEADYSDFRMIVEVTMSTGNKQYEMEGEPVARHFGNIQKKSDQPVYCIFIAPKISEGALGYFFNTNRFKTAAYGGKTRIVPMTLNQFIQFITLAKDKGFNDSKVLKSYLDGVIADVPSADDEIAWSNQINDRVANWVQA